MVSEDLKKKARTLFLTTYFKNRGPICDIKKFDANALNKAIDSIMNMIEIESQDTKVNSLTSILKGNFNENVYTRVVNLITEQQQIIEIYKNRINELESAITSVSLLVKKEISNA